MNPGVDPVAFPTDEVDRESGERRPHPEQSPGEENRVGSRRGRQPILDWDSHLPAYTISNICRVPIEPSVLFRMAFEMVSVVATRAEWNVATAV